ncbi:MAG TPA: response regulator [Pyrinomonadaceae bacterium]|jgi:DNA-binding response OmpR family regulator|nr:response regulator [Pyrinomonadaceae bacterium]
MNSKPPRILFVDDHKDTLELFQIALSHQNYEVVTASSIEQALQETDRNHFDLLILDSWIGDGSGVDLCKSIRERDQGTPIVFCSGLAAEKYRREALAAGAQCYLTKPVSMADLYATVGELTSRSSRPMSKSENMNRKTSGDLVTAPS